MDISTNKEFGALGEKRAAAYLKKQGYKILEKNYKCKLGEIDIIARSGDTIAFVEVKTRPASPYLSGMYAVDQRKQEHILRTASYYLSRKKCPLQPRLDVIEVELDRTNGDLVRINHIPGAFMQKRSYARY